MIRSMTGYGRGETQYQNIRFTIECKSVNNRYLDTHIRIPKRFAFAEQTIQSIIKSRIKRGRVDCYINYEIDPSYQEHELFDMQKIDRYVEGIQAIQTRFDSLSFDQAMNLITLPDVIQSYHPKDNEKEVIEKLNKACQLAVDELIEMRQSEGQKIAIDIKKRLNTLQVSIQQIEKVKQQIENELVEKIHQKMQKLLEDYSLDIDTNRILQEAALLADKQDITEEIIRFQAHWERFKEWMDSKSQVGRKFDFILQEMNREINTVGSKSNDLVISSTVIEMKSELEKIREQVQNIE